GDAMNLPFEDDEFDYVTIGFGLRNVPDYKHVLNELKRVVKPGGMVVCLETSQPTIPVVKQLYSFYFKNIMPLFGKLFAKSLQEYNCLQESTQNFPGKKELDQMFADVGYERIKYKGFTGGVSAMHLAYKPKKKGDHMYDKTKIKLNKEVKEVEKLLNSYINSEQSTVNEACQYLLSSGGKRIRPLFTLIASQFGDSGSKDVRAVATTLELIHMASLVHDDVIDKSDKRRGKYTIAKKWDTQTAVLTGNYLLSQSLNVVSTIEHDKLHEQLAKGIIEVCR